MVEEKYAFRSGDVWLGRSPSERQVPIGYRDDRHVCLVSGSRGGKGTTSIVNNLCLWPGSAVVVDPKGENATVTAARRGRGADHCKGLGQAVRVLDPFKAAQVDDAYRARFNPLEALNPDHEEAIDEAGRIADAIVVIHEDSKDPFWDESARALVKGLILHILTAPEYEGRRNLITLRKLITRGDWESADALREAGEAEIPPAQGLLWSGVSRNAAFEGLVAGIGDSFTNMLVSSPKQFESVLQVANRNTEFIDSPAMQRCLEASDFQISELKTDPAGSTLYLCLPQRYMSTHYRWLRMMISLTITEMEIVRGRPATGFPVLMILDEFAGLKRMEVIEHAVAQIAGYGVKMFFVLQSLEQLKSVYKDNWETFLSNSGLKVFFSLDDHFSRDYVSKLIGETEVIREVRSSSDSLSESESHTQGTSTSQTRGSSVTQGTNWSASDSVSEGTNSSTTRTKGRSWGESWTPKGLLGWSWTRGPNSRGRNFSRAQTEGTSTGRSHSDTAGGSSGTSESSSLSISETESTTYGMSRSRTTGASETVHRRPLVSPDEIGLLFARVDDTDQFIYPGLVLIVISGERAITLRRVNYFEDFQFMGLFNPHPDHAFAGPKELSVGGDTAPDIVRKFLLSDAVGAVIGEWAIKSGDIVTAGAPAAEVVLKSGTKIGHIVVPHSGLIAATSGSKSLTDPLFTMRYYDNGNTIDPFADLVDYSNKRADALLKEYREMEAAGNKAAMIILVIFIVLLVIGFAIGGTGAAVGIGLVTLLVIVAMVYPKAKKMLGLRHALKTYFDRTSEDLSVPGHDRGRSAGAS